jgi:hypothetical protein
MPATITDPKKIEQYAITLLCELSHNVHDFYISQHARKLPRIEQELTVAVAINAFVAQIQKADIYNKAGYLDHIIKMSANITRKIEAQSTSTKK